MLYLRTTPLRPSSPALAYVNSSYHPRRCCLLYMSTCPGAIAGIGVGAVAGVGLVAAAAYFVSKVLRHTQ